MLNSDLLPSLLFKLSKNQATILEFTRMVEPRGSAEAANKMSDALIAIDRDEQFIKMALATLMTSE